MGQPYLGSLGTTRTATVHVIDSRGALVALQVYTGIDAVADPVLAEQLRDDTLNVVQLGGGEMRIEVPVVYHDPAASLMVLVLGDAHRHREIEERIRLLEQLRDDIADIPGYAKDFVVAFGAAGLRALLDDRARHRDALAELAAARVELARLRGEVPGAYDTEQFAAEPDLEIPPGSEVPTGNIVIGPDSEPVIERVVEADEFDGEAGAGDPDSAGDPGRAGLLDSGDFASDAPLESGFDEVPFDEHSLDEVPFDENSFDAEISLDEPMPVPVVSPPIGAPTGGSIDAVDRASTDADAAVEAALEAETGVDAESALADAEPSGPGESPALLVDPTGGFAPRPAGEAGRVPTPHLASLDPTEGFAPRPAGEAGRVPTPHLASLDPTGGFAPRPAGEAGRVPTPHLASLDPADSLGSGSEPVTTEVAELPLDAGEGAGAAGEGAPAARAPGWYVDDAGVHLVIAADAGLAAVLAGPLDLRLVLHRAPTAPVIALVVGSPAALRAPAPGELAVETLDISADRDRGVLRALGRGFALTLTVVTNGRAVRRCKLTAPLADNVGYLMQAADEHLHAVTAHGALDHHAARELVLGAGYDLLGIGHPERSELRVDKLTQIATAQQLRRALAIARRFTRPALEDYLVCTRGFPLSLWHQLRRKTVARAVAWGVWMGPELAQIAVSEGFARSRRDLIARLERGFEKLRHDPRAFDIDAEATADNAAAIADQARTLGVALRTSVPNGAGAIGSDAAPIAAGSIETASSAGVPLPLDAALPLSTDELLEVLEAPATGRDGRARKLAAALALCDHTDPRAAQPVITAALQMSRGEAVRVLARAVKLGPPAHPALIEGLSSSKAYLRHGCALALTLGRSDEATQAVIGLLLSEPTDLWHDIARALGEIGTPALVWLVRDVGRCGPEADERIAWAMAHVGARGGEPALSAMAAAESIVSPIASKALDLLAMMTGDRGAEAVGIPAERDLSVNHAFSQQFFDALEQDAPDDAGAAPAARNAQAAAES